MAPQAVDWSLYAITPDVSADCGTAAGASDALFAMVERALRSGVTVLQVRRTTLSTRDMVRETRRILEMARPLGVPVVVNDRIDVALAADADGVHLGQDDLALEDARRFAPGSWIYGVSTHGPAEARAAEEGGATYVAIGPAYASPSKETGPPGGTDLIGAVRQAVRGPLIAIGGILPANVGEVMEAGADGVAAISGIFGGESIEDNVREYLDQIRKSGEQKIDNRK